MFKLYVMMSLIAVSALLVSCGGGGDSGGSATPPGPASFRILDLTTGAITESTTLPDIAAASATTTTMIFRRVPAGSFTMGSPAGSLGAQGGETQSTVAVGEFWIAIFELTQGQWLTITGDAMDTPWKKVGPSSVTGSPQTLANRPVFGLTYDELVARLTTWNTGKSKALSVPSESQWEYACRAGTTTLFNWGDSLDPAVAGFYAISQDITSGTTGPGTVGGSRFSNTLTLWDMHGNVREWVTTAGNPALRGGSWGDNLLLSRSANSVTSVDQAFRHAFSGARLVLAP